MMISVEGLIRNLSLRPNKYLAKEFIGHLKDLRNNPALHKEFFDLYVFSDDTEWKKTTPAQPEKGDGNP